MLKLLVVDDEPIHRRELANLIRTLRSSYEVWEAENGKEALEVMNNQDFNILVTDVKMPLMDGLELIEALGERVDRMKVIVLSGYEYFDYAKRALKLGACDYVLKPIDEDAVEGMLQNVEDLIEKQMDSEKANKMLQQQLDKTYPMYIDHVMNRFTQCGNEKDEVKKVEDVFSREGQGRIFALYLYDSEGINTYANESGIRDTMKSFLRYTSHDMLKQYGHTISFFLDDPSFLMLGIMKPKVNEDTTYITGLKNVLSRLSLVVCENYQLKIRIGISGSYLCLYDNYKKAVDEAIHALNYGFYSDEQIVLYHSEQDVLLDNTPLRTGTTEMLLRDAVSKYNKNKAWECFNEVVASISSDVKPVPTIVKGFLEETLSECLNSIVPIIEKDCLDEINKKIKELAFCGDFSMLKKAAREILQQMLESTQKIANDRNYFLIQKCINFVSEHYSEEINVDTLANIFHFNNSYFSTIFKKNIGVGLSDYIVDVRMQKALELLQSSSFKVYEVAQKVGYKDGKYFCKVFKNKHGVTPNYFRRYSEVGREAL